VAADQPNLASGYAPTNETLDRAYREIRVCGREPMTVRTRAGYVASKRPD
jgi:hypothetical protein